MPEGQVRASRCRSSEDFHRSASPARPGAFAIRARCDTQIRPRPPTGGASGCSRRTSTTLPGAHTIAARQLRQCAQLAPPPHSVSVAVTLTNGEAVHRPIWIENQYCISSSLYNTPFFDFFRCPLVHAHELRGFRRPTGRNIHRVACLGALARVLEARGTLHPKTFEKAFK